MTKITASRVVRRISLVTHPQYLLELEHDQSSDRIRRIYFDRVSAVVIWTTLPWLRLVFTLVLLFLTALLLLLPDGYFFLIFIACEIGIAVWWLVCRKTHLRIYRNDQVRDFSFIASPGRVRRFTLELVAGIRNVQSGAVPPTEEDAAMHNGV